MFPSPPLPHTPSFSPLATLPLHPSHTLLVSSSWPLFTLFPFTAILPLHPSHTLLVSCSCPLFTLFPCTTTLLSHALFFVPFPQLTTTPPPPSTHTHASSFHSVSFHHHSPPPSVSSCPFFPPPPLPHTPSSFGLPHSSTCLSPTSRHTTPFPSLFLHSLYTTTLVFLYTTTLVFLSYSSLVFCSHIRSIGFLGVLWSRQH